MSTQHPNLSHVTPDQHHPKLHHANHQTGGSDVVTVTEAELSFTDVTTADASTSKHGLVKKLPNDATKYYDGTGNYSVPAGGGGSSPILTADVQLTNAQIKALVASPFQLAEAPGANQVWIINSLAFYFKLAGGAYASADDYLYYIGFGPTFAEIDNAFAATGDLNGFLPFAQNLVLHEQAANFTGKVGGTATDYANKPLFLTKATQDHEFTGGNAANGMRIVMQLSKLPAVLV